MLNHSPDNVTEIRCPHPWPRGWHRLLERTGPRRLSGASIPPEATQLWLGEPRGQHLCLLSLSGAGEITGSCKGSTRTGCSKLDVPRRGEQSRGRRLRIPQSVIRHLFSGPRDRRLCHVVPSPVTWTFGLLWERTETGVQGTRPDKGSFSLKTLPKAVYALRELHRC